MDPQISQPVVQTDHAMDAQDSAPGQDALQETPPKPAASGLSSWARNLVISNPMGEDTSQPGNTGRSAFARLTSGLGFNSPRSPKPNESSEDNPTPSQPGVLGSFTKGLVDSSKNAVKAVQVKARHMVSQNKRRYQEGGYDLDMTYITENIIAMGFPAGDMSSGFFGYVEGFYRNHMEEVIKFFESHHKGKYKVYNLCSERLYDASLFEGKVACFPFDDHNCPPIQLIISFCQSAYSWLKEDIENVVVVHCKAGMARTGLMISSLLLYLKFFPTAEESMDYYNQKRCVDGKGLVLPSQIRYVKYFERILTYFNGENQPGRRCMLRGFRLHKCPYWIRPSLTISNHNGILFSTKKHPRTKNLMPEDFWFSAPKKGIMVFALPGEPGLTEVAGDFKIHFHDRHGDFYCWLNTTMIENRKFLNTSELDGFDKRKLPSPGFQVEVVVVDYDGSLPSRSSEGRSTESAHDGSSTATSSQPGNQAVVAAAATTTTDSSKRTGNQDEDDVFSENEAEEPGSSRNKHSRTPPPAVAGAGLHMVAETKTSPEDRSVISSNRQQRDTEKKGDATVTNVVREQKKEETTGSNASVFDAPKNDSTGDSEFKAIAADASVFSFGDEDDYESE